MEADTLQVEKALKRFKSSIEMFEKTKKDTSAKLKEKLNADGTRMYTDEDIRKELDIIQNAENDTIEQYKLLGGNMDDINVKSRRTDTVVSKSIENAVLEKMKEIDSRNAELNTAISEAKTQMADRFPQEYIPTKGNYSADAAFDIIKLPSKGEGYKDKISKMSVAYLNACDENMIVSPNLYKENLILDYLLQEKVLSKEIDPMDLLEGDRDAIILFLRASGYGNEYPITATDDATGREFDTSIDLSLLKYKEFNLVGDSNGWFAFTLPVSGKEVKFRFPTHRDNIILETMQKAEDSKIMKDDIKRYVESLDNFIEMDKSTSKDSKIKVRQSIRAIENWGNSLSDEDIKYNHTITNKLNLLVMAVDGITDRQYINDFISKMPIRDSAALRKYIAKNEPGIDYTVTIERPESLGGGSFETFLQLDQFLFLNLPE